MNDIAAHTDLSIDGAEIQTNSKIKMTFMKLMSNLKIIYVDDNGKATVILSEVENSLIGFITDHFSHYGVIRVEKKLLTN